MFYLGYKNKLSVEFNYTLKLSIEFIYKYLHLYSIVFIIVRRRCSTQGIWDPATPCLGTPDPSGNLPRVASCGAQKVPTFGGFRISEFRIKVIQHVVV
jgi:hypothetical protein